MTCYEVPIRIGRRLPDEHRRSRAARLRAQLVEALDHMEQLIDRAVGRRSRAQGRRAAGNSNAKAKPQRKLSGIYIDKLYARYVRAQTGLERNWRGLRGEDLLNARGRMLQFIQTAVGKSGLLEHLATGQNALSDESNHRMETERQHCEELQHQIRPAIAPDSEAEAFKAAIPLIGELDGLFGVARALVDREQSVLGLRTAAAFDSELALVLWDDYELDKWQKNELYHNLAPTTSGPSEPAARRTLMVARLDGPTPGIVRRMIDHAMETERRGLRGTFYFDTRGLSKDDPFFDFDQNIRELAQLVQTQTSIPVVVDANAEVFQPGTCPDAALYCGWYNLRNYVDAFDFVPGAVAIHIASFELTTLRAPEKRYWCKELLKDGVAATYGATDEPFLQAFPLPTDFFTMLLTGRFTLVETFSATKPFASWQLSLLGDPLYNPFKQNPQLSWDEGVDP
ncbi:MAG: TIGR03790 family protein [Planctomycetes bacterium]|nr:TIGR03790 family protein [Planctomycetota bacterium]